MTFDPHTYNIRVRRIVEGEQAAYEATVAELPYVLGHGRTAQKAYDEAIEAISALHEAALEDQQPFPDPIIVDDEVSGRVTLRMSKTLHQVVTAAAHREGVSLNSYICETLAVGLAQFGRETMARTFLKAFAQIRDEIGAAPRQRTAAGPHYAKVVITDLNFPTGLSQVSSSGSLITAPITSFGHSPIFHEDEEHRA